MIEHAGTFNRVLLDFLGRAEKAWSENDSGPLQLVEATADTG